MGRSLSLLGFVVFTLGVTALASLARSVPAPAAPCRGDDLPPAPPRPTRIPALAYHAAFSLN